MFIVSHFIGNNYSSFLPYKCYLKGQVDGLHLFLISFDRLNYSPVPHLGIEW